MPREQRPNLGSFTLIRGGGRARGSHVCLMQAVAYWDGQPMHTDWPRGVSKNLNYFGIMLNDTFADADRQRLIPFIPRLAGSERPREIETERMRLLCQPTPPGCKPQDATQPRATSDGAGGTCVADNAPDSWDAWVPYILAKQPQPIHGSLTHLMPASLMKRVLVLRDHPCFVDAMLQRFESAIALGENVPWGLDG